ncbi:MAG: hypothetical protein CM15mP65_06000 [Crocinitomicaceae bacterium]|nr:MAG: hypothetical protein CM15mP65_06000 [Crocinitomicaceae bacterium]
METLNLEWFDDFNDVSLDTNFGMLNTEMVVQIYVDLETMKHKLTLDPIII